MIIPGNSNAATKTWTGTTSTDWNLAGKWRGGLPANGDDISIPGGLTRYPVAITQPAAAISLSVTHADIMCIYFLPRHRIAKQLYNPVWVAKETEI